MENLTRGRPSRARLEALLAERRAPGADRAAIDARIWELFGERRTIMFTDLAGFSERVAEHGIVHFLQVIHEAQRVLVPIVEEHGGVVLKFEADSMLIVFHDPDRALACSLSMQEFLDAYNAQRDPSEHVLLCVGLGHGDVLCIDEHELWGAQVNAASQLGEDTAAACEVLVTQALCDALTATDGLCFAPLERIPPGAVGAYCVSLARSRP